MPVLQPRHSLRSGLPLPLATWSQQKPLCVDIKFISIFALVHDFIIEPIEASIEIYIRLAPRLSQSKILQQYNLALSDLHMQVGAMLTDERVSCLWVW